MALTTADRQTDVGRLPASWHLVELKDITSRVSVGIASAATHAYRDKGIPLLRNLNIKRGYLDDSDLIFIDPAYEKGFQNKRLQHGDLITVRTGYPGATCVVPHHHEGSQCFTSLITSPVNSVVDSSYLALYINSDRGRSFIESAQIGGAQKNVNAGTLRKMPIVLPSLSEQQAIAEALSDMDTLIAAQEALIEKKRAIKQGAMQELLTGRRRLPGFEGEWDMDCLESRTGKLISGVSVRSSDSIGDANAWILKTSCIQGGAFHGNQRKAVVPDDVLRLRTPCETGTILISRMNTIDLIGECGYVAQAPENTYLPDRLWAISKNAELFCSKWLNYMLSFNQTKQRIKDMASGTSGSMKNISQTSFLALMLAWPSLKEQNLISDVLSDIDSDIAELITILNKLRQLKWGMTQELLTGRIRLK